MTPPASTSQPAGPEYRRPMGFFHNRRVRAEIAGLDAQADCQRIVGAQALARMNHFHGHRCARMS